ncbi:MAG: ATPase [Clostridia bacterium]|nr:ATPase [Clostridia bacterium]
MSLEKMSLVRITGPLESLDRVIDIASRSGEFQAEQAMQYVGAAKGYTPINEVNMYEQPMARLQRLASASNRDLEPTDEIVCAIEDDKLIDYINEIESDLGAMQEKREALRRQMRDNRSAVSKLRHFTGLDIDMHEVFECKYIKTRFGRLPKESYAKLSDYEDNPYIMFSSCSTDAEGYWGVYFAPINEITEVDRVFAGLYFERLIVPGMEGTPEEGIEKLRHEIECDRLDVEALTQDIARFWEENTEKMRGVYTRLYHLSNAFEMRRYACSYGQQFYYVGWTTEKNGDRMVGELNKIDGVDARQDKSGGDVKHSPPSKLRNNPIFRPFEYYVEMFGMPSYGEIDPTPVVAITYILLFGIMFADVGQGIVLSIIGYLMYRIKKMELGRILIPCGIAGALFGLVFGSVFGFEHALDPLYRALGFAEKPIEVLESETIKMILIASVALGAFMVVFSIVMNMISSAKQKHWGALLFSHNGLAGLLFYTGIIYSLVAMLLFGRPFSVVIIAVVIICLLLMFLQEPLGRLIEGRKDWKPESIGDFILSSFFECFEYILSYVSNTMSYLRVGAFILVHAGMMMVVFSLVSEEPSFMNIIVLVLGNALVICLEGLLVGIQVLRLEFYEMFSRYYKGEGRKFEPNLI